MTLSFVPVEDSLVSFEVVFLVSFYVGGSTGSGGGGGGGFGGPGGM